MRFGMLPDFAKELPNGAKYRTYNARTETGAHLSLFRSAWPIKSSSSLMLVHRG